MDPISGFGLILSLIPLYQRERDKQKQASKEDFYQWLIEHNFQEIKDCITSNYELGTEIENLLRMNQDELLARFDEVDKNLFRIMNSMKEFRNLIKIIAPTAQLTEQEESILKQFVESGACNIIDMSDDHNPISWHTENTEIIVKNPRFFNANLTRLSQLGFLLERANARGNHYYQLTEQAVEYVSNLKKYDLSEEAKSILQFFVNSNGKNLYKYPVGPYHQKLSTDNGKSFNVKDIKFLDDDLGSLCNKKFISYQKTDLTGAVIYTLTRAGEKYIRQNGA